MAGCCWAAAGRATSSASRPPTAGSRSRPAIPPIRDTACDFCYDVDNDKETGRTLLHRRAPRPRSLPARARVETFSSATGSWATSCSMRRVWLAAATELASARSSTELASRPRRPLRRHVVRGPRAARCGGGPWSV
ncbi:hypothetical protein PVAP13_2NG420100 [Panicum virgatum]|uniref:Uncharacterized protein n=1 Tax=Panicum virgatum TaxID=38727 RepID=A0A8T0VXD8_PANVG|nr:hypothetical protein PVAP13_2NG420100 [Panicum virgatum]